MSNMIKIGHNTVRNAGSCNFCDQGVLHPSGNNLIYPYEKVTTIESPKGGIRANICNYCLEDLIISYDGSQWNQ
jgi:hypothetical protein